MKHKHNLKREIVTKCTECLECISHEDYEPIAEKLDALEKERVRMVDELIELRAENARLRDIESAIVDAVMMLGQKLKQVKRERL